MCLMKVNHTSENPNPPFLQADNYSRIQTVPEIGLVDSSANFNSIVSDCCRLVCWRDLAVC